jgi:hypothetical protein
MFQMFLKGTHRPTENLAGQSLVELGLLSFSECQCINGADLKNKFEYWETPAIRGFGAKLNH